MDDTNNAKGAASPPLITNESASPPLITNESASPPLITRESASPPLITNESASPPLTIDELATLTDLQEGGISEASIRGHRVLIVAAGLGSNHLAQLAALDGLDGFRGEVIVLGDGHARGALLEEPLRPMDMSEMVLAVGKTPYEDNSCRGKRGRFWESPYGNNSGKYRHGQKSASNIRRMLRRPGGR